MLNKHKESNTTQIRRAVMLFVYCCFMNSTERIQAIFEKGSNLEKARQVARPLQHCFPL